ncbi:MAG: alginate lyase family protein, partial [FCB group bacterium]|nr:alginate lyase family protein [FCB group bacterium]
MIWLCCLMTLAAPSAYIEVYTAEGPTGEIFLTRAEAEEVRARIEIDAEARATADGLIASARNLAAAPLDIPRASGLWAHLYTCPVDGVRLEARLPEGHTCPVCGEVYRGDRYEGAWRSYRHKFWTAGVETLGWAYALNEDPAFATRVREILLEYAAFYEELPQLGRDGKPSRSGGRIHAQTLDEAMALVEICVGYSLVREAPVFSNADRRTIRERLIRPMVRVIQPNNRGISNWQSWHNAAVGCAGFLLGDGGMADWAINGEHGFVYQMEHAVKENGVWREESMSYHWLALRALVYLAEAATRADVDLYAVPQVKMLFDAPLRHLFPDLTFPPLHNADRSSITEFRALYEVAYRRTGDARYA